MILFELPEAFHAGIDAFEADVQAFANGKLELVRFTAARVAHGILGQRQQGQYIIRIRCSAGIVTPRQLRAVAALAEKFALGRIHVTTRQTLQIAGIQLNNLIEVMRGLAKIGLSSRGCGGNGVRNIIGSVDSGVSQDEVFDIEPYVVSLTSRLMSEPDSWDLPRKLKIAFFCNNNETMLAQSTCLSFVAKELNGEKGFEVYCGGGLGVKPKVGLRLLEFLAPNQVYQVTHAVKNIFDQFGNRRQRSAGRLKFLRERLGDEKFKEYFLEIYNKICLDKSLSLRVDSWTNEPYPSCPPAINCSGPEFEKWKQRHVFPQRQAGLASIRIPLHLGDISSNDINKLCGLLESFGENTVRVDRTQNIRLRNIPETHLGNVYQTLCQMDTLSQSPAILGNIVVCDGAGVCRAGLCRTRDLVTELRKRLDNNALNLDQISELKIHISGCGNSCSLTSLADLGLAGKAARKGGTQLYPAYNILIAGESTPSATTYTEKAGTVAARDVPSLLEAFLSDYMSRKADSHNYQEYLSNHGRALIKERCETLKQQVPIYETNASYYVDFGATEPFSVAEVCAGECSASRFDLIEIDRLAIEEKRALAKTECKVFEKAMLLYDLLLHTSRILLTVQGLDPRIDRDTFGLFKDNFIESGIIPEGFKDLVLAGKETFFGELNAQDESIYQLADAVLSLYDKLDDSLKFPEEISQKICGLPKEQPHATRDLRNVKCPMNFVKTKLALEAIEPGHKLEILLDDGDPINNVPRSVKNEGHDVLEIKQVEHYWSVLIRKC